MRLGLVLLLVSATAVAGPKKRGNTVVTVTSHQSTHCGGTAIRPGEKTSEDHPAAGMTLLVRKGKTNGATKVIKEVTTDMAGQFDVDLPKGTYCVITKNKRDVTDPDPPGGLGSPTAPKPIGKVGMAGNVDAACVEAQKRQCDAVIVAPTTKGKVDLYSGCFPPCYRGPAPP